MPIGLAKLFEAACTMVLRPSLLAQAPSCEGRLLPNGSRKVVNPWRIGRFGGVGGTHGILPMKQVDPIPRQIGMNRPARYVLFSFIALFPILPAGTYGLGLTGISLGAGDWISLTDGEWSSREEYGTLPSLGLYFSGWGWNGGLGLPVKTTFKRIRHETRFAFGDAEITVGKKMGAWTPRSILRIPLYAWSVQDASENELFIGSGTIRAGLGLGFKAPQRWLPSSWNAGIDLEAVTAVTDGLAEAGSTQGTCALQIARSLGPRWKGGVTSLLLFDYWKWIPDYWDQKGETKITIAPGAVAGVRLFRATYVDAKAGLSVYEYQRLVEPKYRASHHASYYFNLSAYQGL